MGAASEPGRESYEVKFSHFDGIFPGQETAILQADITGSELKLESGIFSIGDPLLGSSTQKFRKRLLIAVREVCLMGRLAGIYKAHQLAGMA